MTSPNLKVTKRATRHQVKASTEVSPKRPDDPDEIYAQFVTKLNQVSDTDIENALIEIGAQLSLR